MVVPANDINLNRCLAYSVLGKISLSFVTNSASASMSELANLHA